MPITIKSDKTAVAAVDRGSSRKEEMPSATISQWTRQPTAATVCIAVLLRDDRIRFLIGIISSSLSPQSKMGDIGSERINPHRTLSSGTIAVAQYNFIRETEDVHEKSAGRRRCVREEHRRRQIDLNHRHHKIFNCTHGGD